MERKHAIFLAGFTLLHAFVDYVPIRTALVCVLAALCFYLTDDYLCSLVARLRDEHRLSEEAVVAIGEHVTAAATDWAGVRALVANLGLLVRDAAHRRGDEFSDGNIPARIDWLLPLPPLLMWQVAVTLISLTREGRCRAVECVEWEIAFLLVLLLTFICVMRALVLFVGFVIPAYNVMCRLSARTELEQSYERALNAEWRLLRTVIATEATMIDVTSLLADRTEPMAENALRAKARGYTFVAFHDEGARRACLKK